MGPAERCRAALEHVVLTLERQGTGDIMPATEVEAVRRPTDMPVYDANGGVAGVDLTAFPDAAATVLFSTFTTCMAA